jgi:hypothetical protein
VNEGSTGTRAYAPKPLAQIWLLSAQWRSIYITLADKSSSAIS